MNPTDKFWRAALVITCCAAISFLLWSYTSAEPELQGANSCLNAPVSTDPTATVCISNVTVPFNGTSGDNQFYVSWLTRGAVSGHVTLTGGDTFSDVRGDSFKGTTHYVRVSNLAAKTAYTFDVISDDTTYTNGGGHWSARLGPAMQPATPYFIFGRVKNPDGSDADGALVLAQVRDGDKQGTQGRSGLLSALINLADGGNFFNINLANARTQNNNQSYTYSADGDRVFVAAFGAQGRANKAFKISDLHPPKPPPSLILGNGSGSVVTATPTLIPPSLTPTLSPTPTETETPVPTDTDTPEPPTETAEPIETETVSVPPTFETVPTLSPDQATALAQDTNATDVANAAGQTQPTRIYGGVPVLQPAQQSNAGTWVVIGLAAVLIVGGVLLGLAAFFVSRR